MDAIVVYYSAALLYLIKDVYIFIKEKKSVHTAICMIRIVLSLVAIIIIIAMALIPDILGHLLVAFGVCEFSLTLTGDIEQKNEIDFRQIVYISMPLYCNSIGSIIMGYILLSP